MRFGGSPLLMRRLIKPKSKDMQQIATNLRWSGNDSLTYCAKKNKFVRKQLFCVDASKPIQNFDFLFQLILLGYKTNFILYYDQKDLLITWNTNPQGWLKEVVVFQFSLLASSKVFTQGFLIANTFLKSLKDAFINILDQVCHNVAWIRVLTSSTNKARVPFTHIYISMIFNPIVLEKES